MISKEVKRARVTAIVFGTLSGLTLIAFVFAFIQKEVAKSNLKMAEQQALIANQNAERSIACERLAKEMQLHAEEQRGELQKNIADLELELKKLRNSRIK